MPYDNTPIFLSLTDLIDLAGSNAQVRAMGKLQGPLCIDYLQAQLILVEGRQTNTCTRPSIEIPPPFPFTLQILQSSCLKNPSSGSSIAVHRLSAIMVVHFNQQFLVCVYVCVCEICLFVVGR